MSGDGRWFVLFPVSRTPGVDDVERALREITDAVVTNAGRGAFTVALRGRMVSLGLDTRDDVAAESLALLDRLQLDVPTREYLAKCEFRYACAFEPAHAAELMPLLTSAAGKLRTLTGGMIVDANALRVVEPPLDRTAVHDKPEVAVMKALRVFADGGPAPRDMSIQHSSTSAHVTTTTSANLNGDVFINGSTGAPQLKGTASIEGIRGVAKAIILSGFPNITLPPGTPLAPPTVPPVEIRVYRGSIMVQAYVPASNLDAVPLFKIVVAAAYALGEGARRAGDAVKAALQKLADGAPLPGSLTIESTFEGASPRKLRLRLESNGAIFEEEIVGTQSKETMLGPALADERKAIARAVLDAGFPHGHGRNLTIQGPHYVFRVVHGLDSVEVVVDAENPDALEGALRGLYAAASRFGVRPLAPVAATPSEPPGRSSAPALIAPQLLDFVNKRTTFATLSRWLAENQELWVPATTVEGGGHMPRITRSSTGASISVCTSEAALDQWFARFGAGQPQVAMNDTSGAALFWQMPEFVTRVDVDPASPLTLQIHGEPLEALRAVARAVVAEAALGEPDDDQAVRLVLEHTFRIAWRQGAIQPAAGGKENALLVAVSGANGELLAAAFTADDCADAYFMSTGGGRTDVSMGTMTGRDLFASLGFLRVAGVSFNPSGPGVTTVLTKDACARMLAI